MPNQRKNKRLDYLYEKKQKKQQKVISMDVYCKMESAEIQSYLSDLCEMAPEIDYSLDDVVAKHKDYICFYNKDNFDVLFPPNCTDLWEITLTIPQGFYQDGSRVANEDPVRQIDILLNYLTSKLVFDKMRGMYWFVFELQANGAIHLHGISNGSQLEVGRFLAQWKRFLMKHTVFEGSKYLRNEVKPVRSLKGWKDYLLNNKDKSFDDKIPQFLHKAQA